MVTSHVPPTRGHAENHDIHDSVTDDGEGYVGACEPPEAVRFAEDSLHLVAEVPHRFEARHLEPDDDEHDGGRDARYQGLEGRQTVRKCKYDPVYDEKEDSRHDGKYACLRERRCELCDESADEERTREVGNEQERRRQREHKGGRTRRAVAHCVERGKRGKRADEYPINGPLGKNVRSCTEVHTDIIASSFELPAARQPNCAFPESWQLEAVYSPSPRNFSISSRACFESFFGNSISTRTRRSPRLRPCGTPLPRTRITSPCAMPGSTVSVSSPSSVCTRYSPPKSASESLMGSDVRRLFPSLENFASAFMCNFTYKSPAPPPWAASPRPGIRIISPSSTPEGTTMCISSSRLRTPSPRHASQTVSGIWPRP